MRAPIAVNLVTGFLGVGKTTAVRHLLARHPAGQRWAVLVNEFGEVGVDGTLLEQDGIAVHEVAGGCLCCVSAPAFTTGLNRLVRAHRPDRILIEPSGLGHPAQVLQTLTGPLYAGVLDVRATLCLLDARHLASPRHREHPNFQDQIHLADVLVANKADLYSDTERRAFEAFAAALDPPKQRLGLVEHGRLDPAWLDVGRDRGRRAAFPEAHAFLVDSAPTGDDDAQRSDWLLIEGHGDGYQRAGWLIRPRAAWPHAALRAWVAGLDVERKKGIVLTDAGWQAFNQDAWQATAAPPDGHCRIELIDAHAIDVGSVDHGLAALGRSTA
ncbi:MAG: GTP-binding protein [Gammaproteobacteria bacterium]|nr:GTP-binding protein [Gammaproteobacteria bacterium]